MFTLNLLSFFFCFQARKKLVAIFQSVVDERRNQRRKNPTSQKNKKKDMMDALMDVADEKGRKLDDEEIIDVLVMYLNAGHESSGHICMWATLLLQNHPEVLRKAKVFNLGLVYHRFHYITMVM